MDLLYIWHDPYKYWSKILYSTMRTPAFDLEINVRDLETYVKVMRKCFQDLLVSKSLHGFSLYFA